MRSGQDFMRSKFGMANTYQRGNVNALDYRRQLSYSGTHDYIRAWIRFRLSEAGKALRCKGALQDGYLEFFVNEGSSAVVAVFNADYSVKAPQLVFAVNPHSERVTIQITADFLENAVQIADHERFDPNGLSSALVDTSGGLVELPPYSCMLWLGGMIGSMSLTRARSPEKKQTVKILCGFGTVNK